MRPTLRAVVLVRAAELARPKTFKLGLEPEFIHWILKARLAESRHTVVAKSFICRRVLYSGQVNLDKSTECIRHLFECVLNSQYFFIKVKNADIRLQNLFKSRYLAEGILEEGHGVGPVYNNHTIRLDRVLRVELQSD